MTLRNTLSFVFVAIIFAFVAAFAFNIFGELFFHTNDKVTDSFYGAFLGAFFAFLFVRISDVLTRLYDRQTKNYNTLIQFEHHLNKCLGLIGENFFIVKDFKRVFSEPRKPNEPTRLYRNEFSQIPLEYELLPALTNIDLVNELFLYNGSIRKLNGTMENLAKVYDTMRAALLEGKTTEDNYYRNVARLLEGFDVLDRFLNASAEETDKLVATIRVLMHDRPFLASVMRWTTKTRYAKSFAKRQSKEIETVKRERKEILESSEKKIREILQQKSEPNA